MKTLREIVAERNPEAIRENKMGGVEYCPVNYFYLSKYLGISELTGECPKEFHRKCRECWNREAKEEPVKEIPKVLYPTTRNLDEGLKNNNLTVMAKKLCEEAVEVIEAVTKFDMNYSDELREQLAQELLDVQQVALNIINNLKLKHGLRIDIEIMDHNDKLLERGWEWDTSLRIEIKEG